MSAEGNLYNPAIFAGVNLPAWQLANEYLEICKTIPTKIACIRAHIFKIYRPALPYHVDLREQLAQADTFEELCKISEELKERLIKISLEYPENTVIQKDETGFKIFPYWICQPNIRLTENAKKNQDELMRKENLSDENNKPTNDEPQVGKVGVNSKLLLKIEELEKEMESHNETNQSPIDTNFGIDLMFEYNLERPNKKVKRREKPICFHCKNVASLACAFSCCKLCCRTHNAFENCSVHQYKANFKKKVI
ncbi:hypothetical protein Glove_123g61 [Diversispora epigaea]|uniref:Uncharacterized protein n=1 Tax=Diversispora epigaea TaxID=1348612 RepID=A0A397J2M5_9GLOM|nr:hypothetical protein Glove_123g61 [Diversispora epigaea]